MIFHKLTLFNFGPYKDEQSLVFPSDNTRNVMAIFGDNMRGKTSLMNSLRWIFYEQAINRYGNPINRTELLNYEAAQARNYRMWVSLTFEHDDHEFEMRRDMESLPMVYQPKSDKDYNIRVLLKRDGQVISGDQIEWYVEQFLPKQISRFYLFDAELLQEYEMLVMEESDQERKIRDAIEQILGVPALINARDDVQTLLKKAQQAQAQELKANQAYESLANQSLKLYEEVSRTEDDLNRSRDKVQQLRDSIRDLDDLLASWKDIQHVIATINDLRRKKDELEKRDQELTKKRLTIMKDAWMELLQPRLQAKRATIAEKIQQSTERILKIGALTNESEKYAKIVDQDTCPVCEQAVPENFKRSISSRLKQIQEELQSLQQERIDTTNLTAELQKINQITPVGVAKSLRQVEKELNQTLIVLTQTESDLQGKEEEIRGHKISQISETQTKRDSYVKALGQAEAKVSEIQKAIEEKNAKIKQLAALLGNKDGPKTLASRQVEIYTRLAEVYSRSIEALRNNLREKIQHEATIVFKELTTEKTYSGLQINKNYGLIILDEFGQPVSMRSAGAEQVVAMSLLSALNKASARNGPVVIDTPFGRLDPKHRENILKYLPKMADQVILLVHAGELDPENGLTSIADQVGMQYEIKRVTSAHSRLKRMI